MGSSLVKGRGTFGTAPVFLTAISTILGAILFLRFGYAVGHVGFVGTLAIIMVGHLVTIPTAMALAEIATNQKVEGGGEYYIISRSFGIVIGAAIGVALFLSQAISVAFYVIAFAEAFDPIFRYIGENYFVVFEDKRIVSAPALLLLAVLILSKGADLGIKLLYFVAGTLFLSLIMFFLGGTNYSGAVSYESLISTVENPHAFFLVFAIVFPAFTGMTAGVGLSGDLKDPRRSIPLGTLAATAVGMFLYVAIAYKLAISAPPDALANDQLVMSRIALWGPMIPIGLACATASSALGSALVAPRTLQALANDGIFPSQRLNHWLGSGKGRRKEPVKAAMVVFALAGIFVVIGDVNVVAQIISMFFMVTYGSICLISFLEHFAADPSYRPVFRSRWFFSLLGAVMCLWLMFKMSTPYATLAIVVMFCLYLGISWSNPHRRGLAMIFQGAIFQVSRQLQVFLQKSNKIQEDDRWRPSVVCISSDSFKRLAAFDLLRWISYRYGFGTYLHHIKGYLSRSTSDETQATLRRLVKLAGISSSNVYVDTMVSPSYTSAICQAAQLPGISGKENNMILLEFARRDPVGLVDIIDNYQLVAASNFDVCILGSCDRGFGYHNEIHIWITAADYDNASLMILLGYIILGHPQWKNGEIKLFAIFPEEELEQRRKGMMSLASSGRLPISAKNIDLIPVKHGVRKRQVINEKSRDADLTIVGFVDKMLRHERLSLFDDYDEIGNILWVNTRKEIELVKDSDDDLDLEAMRPKAASTSEPAA
jgi:amino acid transporter